LSETKADPHGCHRAVNGTCVMGCDAPGCYEYPSPFTPGAYLCWGCGKWLYAFAAKHAETDITSPAVSA